MSFLKSIRFRLTAWYTAMLAIGVILFGAIISFAGLYSLRESIDARLEDRVSRLATPLARDFEERRDAVLRIAEEPELAISVFPEAREQITGLRTDADRREFARFAARGAIEASLRSFASALPAGDFIEIRDAAGRLITEASPVAPPENPPIAEAQFTMVGAYPEEYRVLSQTLELAGADYSFVTGASTASIRAAQRKLLSSLLWLVPLFLVLSLMGGYWMSARALRPIDEITTTARSIGIRDLSRRLEVSEADDELKRLAETLNGMLARLENAVRQLQQFTADASHELRTPTAAVRATAELALRRERSPEEYRNSISKMFKESGRMSALIDDLLMLARADQSEEALPTSPIDFNELVAEACDDYQILAEQQSVRLERLLDAPQSRVEGNKAALRRLLIVLLDNAIKYSPPNTAAIVSTCVRDGSLVLDVRDAGPGVPDDALEHIFDRFYRSDSSRARTVGGAGLGLALAKSIADRHGAHISASNSAGGGALFSVEFPTSRQVLT